MNTLRHINLSAAIIVLVCFFLPWEQVSCAGARDTLTGLDLARHDHASLWLVPIAMGVVVVIGLVRTRQEKATMLSIIKVPCGGVAAYLMNADAHRDALLRGHRRARIVTRGDCQAARLAGEVDYFVCARWSGANRKGSVGCQDRILDGHRGADHQRVDWRRLPFTRDPFGLERRAWKTDTAGSHAGLAGGNQHCAGGLQYGSRISALRRSSVPRHRPVAHFPPGPAHPNP